MNKRGGQSVAPPPPVYGQQPGPVYGQQPAPGPLESVGMAVETGAKSAFTTVEKAGEYAGDKVLNFLAKDTKDIGQQPVDEKKPWWKFWGGGSRRRRMHRKSKGSGSSSLTNLMNMFGMKTKRHRKQRGGLGGRPIGYGNLEGSNFPSAANAQGNNIYDLAPFDPSKPFTGGKSKRHGRRSRRRTHYGGVMQTNVKVIGDAPA